MKPFKIGVMVDSFRLGIAEGIRKAAEVGAEGIQIYATEMCIRDRSYVLDTYFSVISMSVQRSAS